MEGSSSEIKTVWRQETAIETSFQTCSPALDDDRVFVGGLGTSLYALSREDGRIVWTVERDGSMSDSSPAYHDGIVYVGSGGGSVYALDAEDGSIVWRYAGPSAITTSPIVRDGVVYVGRNDGVLLALDAVTGSVLFEFDTGSRIVSDIAYSSVEETLYFTSKTELRAHDAADGGRRVWAMPFSADVGAGSPAVDDSQGMVYFAANELRALRSDDGSLSWGTSFFGTSAGSAPVFDERGVYVGGGSGTMYAIQHDESVLVNAPDWAFRTWDIAITATPALGGDRLVAGSLKGDLYVLDAEAGTAEGHVELPCELRSAPIVDDDRLFVAGDGGGVYAFEF
ncbi:outer membrane protein assembly factor BamB family protein [Halapricum salinum]|uniref:outer membrane protein assembly factor BamB family protein n=1 Tax=Halapricum salinum TaxID=1457250 RepID=UPI000678EF82|nr:PQQ-binding-like beta-propeller repeat protein [Halapricum salinum]